jgi:hypothetical protein
MGKEHKPGFIYMRSKILNQEIAWSEKTGFVYCEDKVQYSPREIELLKAAENIEIDFLTHLVKKVFGGEIIRIGNRQGADNKGEPAQDKGPENTLDNSHSGGEVPGTSGNGSVVREGELDIY